MVNYSLVTPYRVDSIHLVCKSNLLLSRRFWLATINPWKKNSYLILLILSSALTFMFLGFSFYWSEDLSDKIIYKLYGFEPYGMGESERWTKVISVADRSTIERVYNGSFGIGWPLKLIMLFVVLMIPYNLIICGIIYGWKRRKALYKVQRE